MILRLHRKKTTIAKEILAVAENLLRIKSPPTLLYTHIHNVRGGGRQNKRGNGG